MIEEVAQIISQVFSSINLWSTSYKHFQELSSIQSSFKIILVPHGSLELQTNDRSWQISFSRLRRYLFQSCLNGEKIDFRISITNHIQFYKVRLNQVKMIKQTLINTSPLFWVFYQLINVEILMGNIIIASYV